jgi:hypothetical protein
VARLRALAAELERLPRSDARDALLRDVRGRFVALEAGAPATSTAWGRDDDAPAAQAWASAQIAAELAGAPGHARK